MLPLYVIILILGLATSYTDIKFKKIRNNHLLLATVLGLAAYASLIATQQITLNMNWAWNLLVGLGIGLLLYFTDTWGAGDAKLFFVFCLLLPTAKYSRILFFPSLAIFVNIFLISTLAISILAAGEIINNRKNLFKKFFTTSTLVNFTKSFLVIFSLKWMIQAAVSLLIPQATPFLSILILFFAYLAVSRIMGTLKNNLVLVLILLLGAASRFFIHPPDAHLADLLPQLKRAFFYTCIFYGISAIFKLDKESGQTKGTIPFAPLMLIGTFLADTDFLNWALLMIKAVQK